MDGGPVTAPHHSGVFICYRRDDSPSGALRIFEALHERLGDDRVFMDVHIPPAVDFVAWIEERLGSSGVVIPVIGRNWLEKDEETGRPRIAEPKDMVYKEILAALESRVTVLPVLVDGAEMPREDELPPKLARLALLQAHRLLSDTYFKVSEERLVEQVAVFLDEPSPPPPPPAPPPPRTRLPAGVTWAGVAGVLLLAAGMALLWRTYVTPHFRFLPVAPGVFTALAPIGVLVCALLVLTRMIARRHEAGSLEIGLLAGFGFEACVKGVSLLGHSGERVTGGGLLWLAGGAALCAAAGLAASRVWRQTPGEAPDAWAGGGTALVATLGAAMIVVAALIPFNIAGGGNRRIVASDSWLGADPIVTALAVLAAAGLLLSGRRRLAAGLFIALGIGSTLLWARYVGIPVAQHLRTEGVASPQPGGFIGLGGSLVVLGCGVRLAAVSHADARDAEPVPTA